MADITNNLTKIDHITTAEEALAILHEHNCTSYKQTNHQGRTLAAYELKDGQLIDITEQEQIKEEIEEQKRVLKHLLAENARLAKKEAKA